MSDTTDNPRSLESALERLESIADRIEAGDLELQESLELYEEGVGLLRQAESLLSAAEQKIERLRADADGFVLEPFDEAGQ